MRDLRDHPELYDGATFADFAEQSDGESLGAVGNSTEHFSIVCVNGFHKSNLDRARNHSLLKL
jgi:hypothetical protein